MLPRWLNVSQDRVTLFIRHDHILVRRYRQAWFQAEKCIDSEVMMLQQTLLVTKLDVDLLADCLSQILSVARWQAADTLVVLSNYFVRYVVIPWNAQLKSEEEQRAFLNYQFSHCYGSEITHWHQTQTPVRYEQNSVASAIPFTLPETIKSVFAKAERTLGGIQPDMIRVLLFAKQTLSEHSLWDACWFVMVDDERVCLNLIYKKMFIWMHHVPAETDVITQVDTTLQRACLIAPEVSQHIAQAEDIPLLLYWPESASFPLPQLKNYRLVQLATEVSSKQNANDNPLDDKVWL